MLGTSNRLRDSLIVIEIAVSVILLAGAGLLIRSYSKVLSENVGFAPSALTMNVNLDDRYNNHQWSPFFQNLLAQVRRLPGVKNAGVVSHLPLSGSDSITTFEVVGQHNDKYALADVRSVTPGYFEAMGIRVIQGRAIDERDGAGQPLVMMVSEGFANKYFSGRSAVGGQIRISESPTVHPVSKIIGVVASVRHWSLEEGPKPTIYSSFAQGASPQGFLAMHLTGDPKQTAASVRAIVRGLDPALAVTDTHTMGDWISLSGAHRRFETVLLGAFAGAALLLALIGLYGLITYSVRQRTAEIGIRMALGATQADVLRMILRQGLRLAAIGSVVGLIGALAATRVLSSWLYQVSPFDPATFIAVPLLLLTVSAGACVIPALRATQTDPAIALRNE